MKSKIITSVPSMTLNCSLSGGVSPSPDDGISRNRQEKRGKHIMKTNYRNADAWVIQARAETMFCGNYVNIGELYGSFDGVHFITEARATASGMYPSMVILNDGSKWVRICPAKISTFLLEAIHQHRIQVWKIKSKSEKRAESAKRREAAIYHGAFDENCNSCVRRFKGKGIGHGNGGTSTAASHEYLIASHEIYGGQVDVNGRIRFMDNKMAQYIDGNTTEGYRPLEPQFPVKSGKR